MYLYISPSEVHRVGRTLILPHNVASSSVLVRAIFIGEGSRDFDAIIYRAYDDAFVVSIAISTIASYIYAYPNEYSRVILMHLDVLTGWLAGWLAGWRRAK